MNDKMFRSKPYTKCIDCINSDKIKCKKCMNKLLDTISNFQNVDNLKRLHIKNQLKFRVRKTSSGSELNINHNQKQHKNFNQINHINTNNYEICSYNNQKHLSKHNFYSIHKEQNKSNKENMPCLIKNKYEIWMDQVKIKNQTHSTYGHWPKKSRKIDWNLATAQSTLPKFEKWERKLIDQLLLRKTNHFQKNNSCSTLEWHL